MTEAEIALQVTEMYALSWTVQQWWASVSIGLLVLSHVAYDRLNVSLVTIIVVLYTAFSAYLLQILDSQAVTVADYLSDLRTIAESGYTLTAGTQALIDSENTASVVLVVVALWGTYVGCIAYLIYSYIRGKRVANA